ncbi:MAG: hypothetical protein ACKVJU_05755 [Verrucomicrobiales bacterium]
MENPDTSDQLNATDDKTWDLLEYASTTEPGAFFSRNVVREVRQLVADESEAGNRGGLFGWFRSPVGAFAVAAIAIAIVAISLAPSGDENGQGTVASITEAEFISSPTDEFADVEYLGELMAVSDPAMLTDQAFADLF